VVDLRLFGFGLRRQPVAQLAHVTGYLKPISLASCLSTATIRATAIPPHAPLLGGLQRGKFEMLAGQYGVSLLPTARSGAMPTSTSDVDTNTNLVDWARQAGIRSSCIPQTTGDRPWPENPEQTLPALWFCPLLKVTGRH